MKVCVVTSNKDRFLFIQESLKKFGVSVFQKNLDLEEIQSDSVKKIAINKVLHAAKIINSPCICEDTELNIISLNGFPGPYLKYVQNKISFKDLVLLLKNKKNKTAIFRSILVYSTPEGLVKCFETKVEGRILSKSRGKNPRGWDGAFCVKKTNKTLAQYSIEERKKLWSKGYNNLGKYLLKK